MENFYPNNFLGILTNPHTKDPPFNEEGYFRYLIIEGKKFGLSIFVFTPNDIQYLKKTVVGYEYTEKNECVSSIYPLPALVYDCLWYRKKYRKQLKWLKSQDEIQFMNQIIGDKLKTYKDFAKHPGLKSFVPLTNLIRSPKTIDEMLNKYGIIIIKPVRHSRGIGVMKISFNENNYLVEGRNKENQIFRNTFPDRDSFITWFSRLKMRLIAQPYLTLTTPAGIPFDIRVLVQKNSIGEWQETGRVARVGQKDGITSNISGGGNPYLPTPFIKKFYSQTQLSKIEENIDYIVKEVPPLLEKKYGPLLELGVDIGIDNDGQVWLIEVNSKPGRSSFVSLGIQNNEMDVRSFPLHYAKYLLSTNNMGGQE